MMKTATLLHVPSITLGCLPWASPSSAQAGATSGPAKSQALWDKFRRGQKLTTEAEIMSRLGGS